MAILPLWLGRLLTPVAVLALAVPCLAQENDPVTIVVTPERVARDASRLANSITVIDAETIERKRLLTLSELLRSVPGIDVVRSGGLGGNTAVFMRGANSEHTLVLIDGVEANNPANPTRAFNFADLPAQEIERIEILRGPQSTLYGSDAIGGVIQVITKRPAAGTVANVMASTGSYGTFIEQAQGGFSDDDLSLSASLSRQDSEGYSAASARYGNSENDGYENSSFTGRAEWTAEEFLRTGVSVRGTNARTEIDNAGGVGADDPNRRVNNDELFLKTWADFSLFEARWKPSLSFGFADHRLDDDNDPDVAHPKDFQRSRYDGELLSFSVLSPYEISSSLSLLLGFDAKEERASSAFRSDGEFGPYEDVLSERDARTNGYFLEGSWRWGERFVMTSGGRVDDHSEFGSESTWRISPALFIPETDSKISGTLGTGFKAPSLIQLYSSFGNPELEPEKSRGWDAGVTQKLFSGQVTLESKYFWNSLTNLVTFNPSTLLLENISQARTSGVESALRISWDEGESCGLTWTYLDSKDESTGEALLRRARNKLTFDFMSSPVSGLKTALWLTAVGSRPDTNFNVYPTERENLGGYLTLNASAEYEISKALRLFVRAENVLDKEYEDVLGYGTPGASVYGGFSLTL